MLSYLNAWEINAGFRWIHKNYLAVCNHGKNLGYNWRNIDLQDRTTNIKVQLACMVPLCIGIAQDYDIQFVVPGSQTKFEAIQASQLR